jgi:hypothetical protein
LSRLRHDTFIIQEEGISELLLAPAKLGVPGISGTRRLSDNLSDLKAQVAANAKGITLVKALIAESSLARVQLYMGYIQANAEAAVRQMLREFSIAQVGLYNPPCPRSTVFLCTAWPKCSVLLQAALPDEVQPVVSV